MLKKLNILSFIFITLLGMVFLAYLFILPVFFERQDIIIPDVIGLDYEAGKLKLEEKGLVVVTEKITSSDTEDSILFSSPKAGLRVKEETIVTLTVAKKGKTFILEDYSNRYYNDIKTELAGIKENYNVEFIFIEEASSEYVENLVIKQLPSKGTVINENDYVIIYVSKNDSYLTLPDFTNWPFEKLMRYEEENKIYFEYNYEYNNEILENHVISQSVDKGTTWLKNSKTTISITISKGKNQNFIPDFVGISLEQALLIAEILNLNIEYTYMDSNASADIVLRQSIACGTIYDEKTILELIIAKR